MTELRTTLLIGFVLALVVPAFSQTSGYPSRAVTLIVPFAPGGGNDLVARLVGRKLEQHFGKPFVIENRPGGGGTPAAMDVVRAAPDGYSLIAASSTMMAFNITVLKSMRYDPRTDLIPIAMTARIPFVLVVGADLPVHSVNDLVTLARQKPGQLTFGAPGPATLHRLDAEMFKSMFGLDFIYVPYKGTLPGMTDVASGNITFMFGEIPAALSLIRAGKLRPLGVTTAQRVPVLPDVPPLAEAGIPGFDSAAWHTVATTANVPKNIIDTLNGAIREATTDPTVTETLARSGAIAVASPPPAELKQYINGEIVRWGKVIEQAGLAHSE